MSQSKTPRSPAEMALIDAQFSADHAAKVTRALNATVRATLDGEAPRDRDMLVLTLYTTEMLGLDLDNAAACADMGLFEMDHPETDPDMPLNPDPRPARTAAGR